MARKKYTYKYNGEVVRNSDHEYKYGLTNDHDAVIKCSSTEKGALAERTRKLNFLQKQLEYSKKHNPEYVDGYMRAIENTKKWHTVELEVIKNF